MRVRFVAIVCAIVIAGSAGTFAQTPASDDAVWEDFVTWLDTMPPPAEVVNVVQVTRLVRLIAQKPAR